MSKTTTDQKLASAIVPGWPAAADPLRVALIGWAQLSLQGREGSGYNLSASELATGLAMSGHRVSYLSSGMRYSLRPGPFIRSVQTWRGIECFDLVNSPNLSPAACNFRNMTAEIASPSQTRIIVSWLDQVQAQIVHIHSLEGYSLDLIRAIRQTNRPVVATLHNYWMVCPQVDLLHEEVRVCDDYNGGRRCEGCLKSDRPAARKFRRRFGQSLRAMAGPQMAEFVRRTVDTAMYRVKMFKDGPEEAHELPLPDPESALGFNVNAQDDHDGRIEHNLKLEKHEKPKLLGRAPWDQNETFLAADHHLTILENNIYGRRRAAGIEALNEASLVTPPSDFLRRVHVAMGVDESRTRTVRLGQPHFDQINRRARRSPYYNTRPWDAGRSTRPLRFGFFGTTRHNKGLDILIRAIPLLEKNVRQRSQFLIRAAGWDWPFRKRVSQFPEVQFAGGYDLMQFIGAWGEYDVGILPHIWFENSPLVMLEHLHGGKLVVSSRLGGPAEWLKEPPSQNRARQETASPPFPSDPSRASTSKEVSPSPSQSPSDLSYNGLMFPAGDPEKLARCITRLVSGEVTIPSPREIHAATPILQSYPGHVSEVASIYSELLGRPHEKATQNAQASIEAKPAQTPVSPKA